MDVASLCSVPVGSLAWNAPSTMTTVIVKATFTLAQDGRATLAEVQEPLELDQRTNLSDSETYSTFWNQSLPALGSLVGNNVFTIIGADVTPAPYNQPPFAPAGDTDNDACTVVATSP